MGKQKRHKSFVPSIIAFICLIGWLVVTVAAQDETPVLIPTSLLGNEQERERLGIETFLIRTVAWSPHSELLAVGGAEGTKLYNRYFQEVAFFSDQPAVTAITWSPDGKYIAISSWDHTIWIWEVETLTVEAIYISHNTRVEQVLWSPNGMYIASGDIQGNLRIWEPFTLNTLEILSVGEYAISINSISWKPDSTQIGFADVVGVYQLYDIEAEAVIWQVPRENDGSPYIVWSPDSKFLATGDYEIEIRQPETGEAIEVLSTSGDGISSIDWSPNGKFIVSNTMRGVVKIWNVSTGELTKTLQAGLQYIGNEDVPGIMNLQNTVDWSPDGNKIAAIGDGSNVYIWDVQTYALRNEIRWEGS